MASAAGLVQTGDPAQLGDRVEQGHEAAGGEHRGGVIGRLRARAPGGPARAPMAVGHVGQQGDAAGRRPRRRSSRRGAPRPPDPCRRRRPAGGSRRPGSRRPSPAARTSAPSAPLVWTSACPLYSRMLAGDGSIASSGTARMISSTSSSERVDLGEGARAADQLLEPLAPGGVAAGDRLDRPAGPGQGQAERRSDGAGADDADERRLAGCRVLVRMGVVVGRAVAVVVAVGSRRDRGRCPPRAGRPASSVVGVRRPDRAPARPSSFAVRFHATSVATPAKDGRVPAHDPFGARASLGPGTARPATG